MLVFRCACVGEQLYRVCRLGVRSWCPSEPSASVVVSHCPVCTLSCSPPHNPRCPILDCPLPHMFSPHHAHIPSSPHPHLPACPTPLIPSFPHSRSPLALKTLQLSETPTLRDSNSERLNISTVPCSNAPKLKLSGWARHPLGLCGRVARASTWMVHPGGPSIHLDGAAGRPKHPPGWCGRVGPLS